MPGESDPNLRPLGRDAALWGMTATQFLGAFNDNVFKQLILLLSVGAPTMIGQPAEPDRQWLAQMIFALPFVMFSGFAGLISERFSKQRVVVLCKVAEIVIMVLGLVAFASWGQTGLTGVLVVLFLMGAQSAFFGPSKFGILPELFEERQLPKVNGIVLMTTFLAIIFGTVLAGVLKHHLGNDRIWVVSIVCVAIAVVGTLTSLLVRRVPVADPTAYFHASTLLVPSELWSYLKTDRQLSGALLVTCMFWLIGGIVHPTVNAVGSHQFEINDSLTSLLVGGMGIGIAVGCLLGGFLSHNRVNFGLMRIGAWSIIGTLLCLALPGAGKWNLLGYWGSFVMLVLLGIAAGLFVVPLQVFLQSRPPDSLKGRTIATMNLSNWIAIFFSAAFYQLFQYLVGVLDWPLAGSFAFSALLMLPIALFYRPTVNAQN